MSRFVLLAVLLLAYDAVVHVSAQSDDWTYGESDKKGGEPYGPSDWVQVYPDCGGNAQSPINLAASTHTVVEATEFELEFIPQTCASTDLSFTADDHVWKVSFGGCSEQASLSFQGEIYNLAQFHIHSSSEHTVGGSLRSAEIHFVHVKEGAEDELLVVGVLLDVIEYGTNVQLQPLWEVLDTGATSTTESFETRVYDLIPPNKVFSHYIGSLTTPPCTEGVTWIVMNDPTVIGKMQLDEFRKSVKTFVGSKVDKEGNTNRPYQPLNGRELFLVKA